MRSETDPQALVRFGLDGAHIRAVCEKLGGAAQAVEIAVRRTLPHLVRRKIPVASGPTRTTLRDDLLGELPRPLHITKLRVGANGRGTGALVLDAKAIAHGFDGMLGAGKGDVVTLPPAGLSPAQRALATRLARGLVSALAEVFATLGVPLVMADGEPSRHDESGGSYVACSIHIGEGDNAGTILVLLPAGAVEVGVELPSHDAPSDPLVQAAMSGVELDVVAELGRVRLPLARLASLAVGDVMALPLPVETMAAVRVGERVLFRGEPTNLRSQIAIAITGTES